MRASLRFAFGASALFAFSGIAQADFFDDLLEQFAQQLRDQMKAEVGFSNDRFEEFTKRFDEAGQEAWTWEAESGEWNWDEARAKWELDGAEWESEFEGGSWSWSEGEGGEVEVEGWFWSEKVDAGEWTKNAENWEWDWEKFHEKWECPEGLPTGESFISISSEGGQLSVSVETVGGFTYQLECSQDGEEWEALGENFVGDGDSVKVEVPGGAGGCVFRAVVTQVGPPEVGD